MWGFRETGLGGPTARPDRGKQTGAGFEPDHDGLTTINRSHWKQPACFFGGREAGHPSIQGRFKKRASLWTPKISTAHPSNRILYPETAYFNAASARIRSHAQPVDFQRQALRSMHQSSLA